MLFELLIILDFKEVVRQYVKTEKWYAQTKNDKYYTRGVESARQRNNTEMARRIK